MIQKVGEVISSNVGKTISIAGVVAVLGLYTSLKSTLLSELDVRYCLAADAQKTAAKLDTWMESDLKNKIFLIDLRIQKGTATDEDRAMRQRYQGDLDALRNPKK